MNRKQKHPKNRIPKLCLHKASGHSVVRIDGRDHYPITLFSAEEAYAGVCTAKATIYCANIAAGLMVAQFAKYLRNLPVDPDIQLNLLTSEITVSP